MIRAAGILILNNAGRALFLKRGADGDMPGLWAFPGGRLEDGETTLDAAVRETDEEAGWKAPRKSLVEWTRAITQRAAPSPLPVDEASPATLIADIAEQVDFTTFMLKGAEEFVPTLNDEHVAYAWAPIDQPPEPLHPGCRVALARSTMDELALAEAMAAGELVSPQACDNMTLVNIRITGTGLSYRTGSNEHVWRDSSLYLNERFKARCNGLPVIVEHPGKMILNAKEFKNRIVGTIMLPYIKGDEVWGVARIYDDAAVKLMTDERLSTSPAVAWRDPSVNDKLELEDGSKFLIEGKPSLLDHIAIVERGVWDKGGDPTGIEIVSQGDDDMLKRLDGESDDAFKARCDEATKLIEGARADGASSVEKIANALTAKLDTLQTRLDSIEDLNKDKKADADENDKKKADDLEDLKKDKKADADDKDDKKDDEDEDDKDKPKKVVDKKADADEDDDKAKADAAVISDLQARLAATDAAMAEIRKSIPKAHTDADITTFSRIQADADVAFSIFGKSAPRPLQGETPLAYRRRLCTELQPHSTTWKSADLGVIAADDASMDIVQRQIITEAIASGRNPSSVPDGKLRPVVRTSPSGHTITEFVGQPNAWMQRHAPGKRFLTAINTNVGK